MPRLDGTGPMGQGAMMGGGRGYCGGGGFGRGMGRGRGVRGWFGARRNQGPSLFGSQQDLQILKNEAVLLKARLGEIEGQIKNLEKSAN